MPCYVTGSAEGDARLAASEARERCTTLTRLLCEAMDHLTAKQSRLWSDELSQWWAEHQRIDEERKRSEAAERLRRSIAYRAINKLNEAERLALGLNIDGTLPPDPPPVK